MKHRKRIERLEQQQSKRNSFLFSQEFMVLAKNLGYGKPYTARNGTVKDFGGSEKLS